jgi:hypothetical protein
MTAKSLREVSEAMTPCPRCEAAAKVCDSLALDCAEGASEADAQYGRDVYQHRRGEAELCALRIRSACLAAKHAKTDAEIVAEIREVHVKAGSLCSFCTWEASDVEWPCDAIRLAAHIEGEKP